MAQRKINLTYKKATLHKNEDGTYIIQEVGKDSSEFFNLTEVLEGLVGQTDLAMAFGSTEEVLPDADDVE